MNLNEFPDNPYLLLTPGPLSTSKGVRAAMFRDWCTWDRDYNDIVQDIRRRITALGSREQGFTSVLMQGSGTFSVEATVGSAVPDNGKLLVLANGHYGQRIAKIAACLKLEHAVLDFGETNPVDPDRAGKAMDEDQKITHVAVVHCETTTGMLNPVEDVGRVVKQRGKVFIVDAMSSFGGIPMDMTELGADFLVSSANKCIQGVPGFGFVIARRERLEECAGRARSLSLDLHAQWREMEDKGGKWRFTSPTHVVRAFAQALNELDQEGGVTARFDRYSANHRVLVQGMRALGYKTLLPDELQSPIITAFHNPNDPGYDFMEFYARLKSQGFVIYPGKVTGADTFRIGTIGHVFPRNMAALIAAVQVSMCRR